MAKTISTKTITIINAITLLIAGILFLFMDRLGAKWLDVILGISVLLLGLITLISEFLKEKTLVSKSVAIGSAIIALGIFIITRHVATMILGLIPIVFIVIGACVFMDSFLLRYWRNNRNLLLFVLEFLIGAFLITLGVLFLTVGSFRAYMSLAFGIILIAYAIYLLAYALTPAREKKKAK